MKGIMKWMRQMALEQLQKQYPDRFKADFGVLPQEMQARCAKGDSEQYKQAVRAKVEQYRKARPQEWAHAEQAVQRGNFPGSGEPWKEKTQLQLERTQKE